MRFLLSIQRRSLRIAPIVATLGSLGLAASILPAGCLTAYPPDLPVVQHRPTILPDEVPEVDVPMVMWPQLFVAYVDVDPGQVFSWAAFLDYDPGNPTYPFYRKDSMPAPPGGGPATVSFSQPMPPDGLCHRIDLVVADAFNDQSGELSPTSYRSPAPSDAGGDVLGGDVATWWYTGGLVFGNCSPFGGALPDGGFPFPDAPSDSPPPVPE
jgi:hypothetical protein